MSECYSPDHKSPPKRQSKPAELSFQFVRADHVRIRYEFRDHGEWGTEVQILHNEEFHMGYRHPTREVAIAWAGEGPCRSKRRTVMARK
jgi:hypothetical protein